MRDEAYRDFVDVIKAFWRQRERTGFEQETLPPATIARMVKEYRGRKLFTASMFSAVRQAYSAYFLSDGGKPYPFYAVNWDRVRQDHPKLLPSTKKEEYNSHGIRLPKHSRSNAPRSTVSKRSRRPIDKPVPPKTVDEFCKDALRALADEYRDAEQRLLSHPVIVRSYSPIDQPDDPAVATLDPTIARIYEAELEYRVDEAPPIPEGVPVRVRWHYPRGALSAKLLQWDMLNGKAYIAFERPLDNMQRLNQSRIELTTHELLKPLAANLEQIQTLDELVLWKLLTNTHPEQVVVGRDDLVGSLDKSQTRAVKKAIESNYAIIWGPPGTGKTHTIGHLICELVQSGKRVLAVSISNVAVDNMAIKFVGTLGQSFPSLRAHYNEAKFLRFGYTRNEELSKEEYKPLFSIQSEMSQLLKEINRTKKEIARISRTAPKDAARLRDSLDQLEAKRIALTREMVTDAKVVFTTAAQVYINSAFESMNDYDVVIIDEVSMMAVPTFSVVAARSRAQAVVVGDFRQLAPIAVSQSAISHEYLHKSPFEWLNLNRNPQHPAMVMLSTQRRMAPSISGWISRNFYAGDLNDDSIVLRDYIVKLPSELPSQLVCWDISNSRHKGQHYETQFSESHSRFNMGSASCCSKLAVRLKELNPGATVAIITTYREQAYIIRREIERSLGEQSSYIHVGTVHTFQGSESDIVIWDTVDTMEVGLGQPYKGDQGDRLTNVAISRARKLMVVACDCGILKKISAQTTAGKFMSLLRDLESCESEIDGWLE